MSEISKIPWNFRLDRKQQLVPQIKSRIKKLITEGYLSPADKMPSAATLAVKLEVSKKTIEITYRELQASKLLESRIPVGTYVCRQPIRTYPGDPPAPVYSYNDPAPMRYSSNFVLPFLKLGSDSASKVVPSVAKNFRKYKIIQGLSQRMPEYETEEAINKAIKEILSERNILVTDGQFCLINGIGRNLSVVVLSLLKYKDCVAMSSPADQKAIASFELVNAQLFFTGSDEEGMDTSALEGLCRRYPITAVFIRPAADYPTCAATSLARRKQILELSERYDFVIIEMYKGHEFCPPDISISLWEMGGHHRVIYLSPVSRMSHALNSMGIVVGAPAFIAAVMKRGEQYSKEDYNSNKMLAKMVSEDTYRLISDQMIKAHRKLIDDITFLVSNYFNDPASYTISQAGWSVWIRFNRAVDPGPVLMELRELGLYHPSRGEDKKPLIRAILLGFGCTDIHVLEKALKIISRIQSCVLLFLSILSAG